MAEITVNNADFGYHNKAILRSISLIARPGELLGIVGPNGCGKTTLLKGMAGLLGALSGEVLLDGANLKKITRRNIAKKIAFVPQNAALPELFTSLEIVLMGRTPHLGLLRYEGETDIITALNAMKNTGTEALVNRRVNEISGGEKQRLLLARAITQQAEIFLLDEPTASIDIHYQAEIFDFLVRLCTGNKISAVIALHDLNLACQFCHRLVMLKDGSIFKEGSPSTIVNSISVCDVFNAKVLVYPHPVNSLPVTVITSNVKNTGSPD